jgi:outer membrane protein assembly factor BamB
MASNPDTTIAQTGKPAPRKPLRLWPGVAIVALQWLLWFVVPVAFPEFGPYGIMFGIYAGLALLLWWLVFSRAPWFERIGMTVLMVVAIVATKRLVHPSIAGGGMGFLLYIYAIPILSLALVAGAAASRGRSQERRRATMVGAILLACAAFTLLRTGGITGEGDSDLHWRWSKTPEERLLAQTRSQMPALFALGEAKTGFDWPGFRGPQRNSVIRDTWIETDWSKSPPVELWRRAIGPGWSSFAVRDNLFYTQEQRGDDEVVSCYEVTSGAPVWAHKDATRFWESNAGAGPRGTPTLSNSRVYTFGATGILNALDAHDGAVIWSRNAAADTGKNVPHWGFASSPLVIDDAVIIAASGRLAAYDIATGEPRWFSPAEGKGGYSYSSPHLVTAGGVPQVLLLKGGGVSSVTPSDGTLLWEHSWKTDVGIVQPALIADGDILITGADPMGGLGMRRLAAALGPDGWSVAERWTSRGLKPYFNDFVVHEAHAFGFDNSILACIDLNDGERKWKGGRYGHGQLALLADQDLLLVLSEDGDLALVRASTDAFTELARFPAIEGKTWNHPVLVGDVLLVRNGEEMAALRLTLASR